MQHTITIGSDGHIHIAFIGDSEKKEAQEFQAALLALLDKYPDKNFDVLADMTRAGSSTPQALKIYAGLMQNKHVKKVALINTGPIPKMFANMAINFSHKTDVQFLDTEAEAEAWLQKAW